MRDEPNLVGRQQLGCAAELLSCFQPQNGVFEMCALCGVVQKQLVALQALLTQLEAELVLAASAAEPPETRDARRTRYWTLFKWLGMSQPQPDQRAGQDALPYGPEAAHSEADRTDLYGLSVSCWVLSQLLELLHDWHMTLGGACIIQVEQREAFIDQLLARGNGMQDGVWHDSFELLRMTLPGSGHILT